MQGALQVAPDGGRAVGITRHEPEDTIRLPRSGRIRATHNLGLKPWAIMCSRFAAKSDTSLPNKSLRVNGLTPLGAWKRVSDEARATRFSGARLYRRAPCNPRSRDRYIFLCVRFYTHPRSLFVAFVGFCVMFSVCVSALGIPMKELL